LVLYILAFNIDTYRKGLQLCKFPFYLFVLGILIRLLLPYSYEQTNTNLFRDSSINKMSYTQIEDDTYTFNDILSNNSIIVMVCLLSWILFGIPSMLILLVNGYNLADVFIKIKLIENPILIVLSLPHMIFEFTGFFLSSGISLNIIQKIILNRKSVSIDFKKDININLLFAGISIALIIIAAIIEYYFTFGLILIL